MCDKGNSKKQRKITEMLQNKRKSKNEKDALNDFNICYDIPKILTANTSKASCQFPVSLKFFKAHTEYDEVIDKILWTSAKGNKDEYKTIKNNDTMREKILLDYYRAFYMKPSIREEYPIKLKAMPKHLKDKMLQIPYPQQQNLQDAVASDDSELITEEEEDQEVQQQEDKRAIDGNGDDILLANISNKWQRGTKRLHINNNNNPNEQPHKRQKDKKIRSESNNITIRSTSMKDLEVYEHCCPITYKEFKHFTNVLSLMVDKFATEPRHRWPYFLKKTYLLFYLKPEVRSTLPFKNIRLKADAICPGEIKNKLYIIPEIYQKSDEQSDVNIEQPKEKENFEIGERSIMKCNEIQGNSNSDQAKDATATKSTSDKTINLCAGNTLEILECRILPPVTFREDNSESLSRVTESIAHVKPMQRETTNNNINNSNTQRDPARLSQENDRQHLIGAITNSQSENLGHSTIVVEHQQQLSTDNNCIFCHFTLDDFMTCTNILQVLAKDINNLQELDRKVRLFYTNFLTERLEAEEMANITMSLAKVNVLKKYRHICLNCLKAHKLNILQSLNHSFRTEANYTNSQGNEISPRVGEINNNESQMEVIDVPITSFNEINETSQLRSAIREDQINGQTNNQYETAIQLKGTNIVEGENITDESSVIEDEPAIGLITDVVDSVPQQASQCITSDINLMSHDLLNKDVLNDCNQMDCENGKSSSKYIGDKNDAPDKFIHSVRRQLKTTLKNLWKYVQYFPVNYETFKEWTEYEEPLLSIIQKGAANDTKVIQMIQNDTELCELLLKKYYVRYFTSEEIRDKYPLKLKLCPPHIHEKMLKYIKKNRDDEVIQKIKEKAKEQIEKDQKSTECDKYKKKVMMDDAVVRIKSSSTITTTTVTRGKFYSGIFSDVFLLNLIAVKYPDPLTQHTVLQLIKQHFPNVTQNSENILLEQEKRNALYEKTKHEKSHQKKQLAKNSDTIISMKNMDSLFSQLDKTHTLSYVLRTRYGLKRDIIYSILEMTFEEFHKLIHIYKADHLKKHLPIMKYYYNRTINGSGSYMNIKIWPINLYIKLHDILDYLKKKNIHLSSTDDKYILKYISPKFLHWIDLLQSTNFLACVNNDFMKSNVIKLDLEDNILVNKACKNYYTRCWKYDEWLWQIPTINDQAMSYTSCVRYLVTDAQQPYQGQDCSFSSFPFLTSDQFHKNHGENNGLEKIASLSRGRISKSLPSNMKIREEIEENEEIEEKIGGRDDTEESTKGNEVLESMEEKEKQISPPPELDLEQEDEENEEMVNRLEEEGVISSPRSNLDLEDVNHLGCNQKADNFITVLNTQQQLQLLPDEISLKHDPLVEDDVRIGELDNNESQCNQDFKTILNYNDINQDDIDTEPIIISIDDADDVSIKTEAVLNNLQFYLNESGDVIHCSPLTEEVIVLDDTDVEESLDLINAECAKAETSTTTMLAKNSNENVMNSNAVALTLDNNLTSSKFDDIYANIESENEQYKNNTVIIQSETDIWKLSPLKSYNKNFLNVNGDSINKQVLHQQQYQVEPYKEDLQNVGTDVDNTVGINVEPQHPPLPQIYSPLHTEKQLKDTSNTKRALSYTKLKKPQRIGPLGKCSDLVPQLNHDFRSLPVQVIVKPNSHKILTTLGNSGHGNGRDSVAEVVSSSPCGERRSTVSQELENDCTVFNNSTLIRITNHKNNEVQSTTTRIANSQIEDSTDNQTRCRGCIPTSHMKQFSTKNQINTGSSHMSQVQTTIVNQCPHNANPIPAAQLTPTPSKVQQVITENKNSKRLIAKPILYRTLLHFEYFIELTPQQIVRYSLDPNEVGNTYYQAGIKCDGLEMSITKDVFPIVFPYWPTSLQRDILYLLNDLKEYHYLICPSPPHHINQADDLRVRILDWLFKTAPSISQIYLRYNVNNPERGFCSKITNRNRLPHMNIMKAIKPSVLNKMRGFLNQENEK